MTDQFVIYNPVKLHFGRQVVEKIGKSASPLGKKALLVYGKGSVKRNGAYDDTVASLRKAGIDIVEYQGIKPNPVVEDVDKAAEIGRNEGVDMVVAVGGGSVLDSAKYIAITIPASNSCWDYATGKIKPAKALPILGVLTLAATGSEMNPLGVVQHDKEKKKVGYGHPLMFPKHSFLDPSYTISVPEDHTAYGVVDLIAHALEGWFGEGDASLTDRFIISIINEAIAYGPRLMADPENYDLRAKIMFAATMALNGLTNQGKKSGDWGVHAIGHAMSVLWDIPHGASLSIAFPAWLTLQQNRIPERIEALGHATLNTNTVDDTIEAMKNFFRELGSPVTLAEAGVSAGEAEQQKLLEVMRINKVDGNVHQLSDEDYQVLIREMV